MRTVVVVGHIGEQDKAMASSRTAVSLSLLFPAAQRARPPGWPGSDPVCNTVPAFQHSEEDTGHHRCQEVSTAVDGLGPSCYFILELESGS